MDTSSSLTSPLQLSQNPWQSSLPSSTALSSKRAIICTLARLDWNCFGWSGRLAIGLTTMRCSASPRYPKNRASLQVRSTLRKKKLRCYNPILRAGTAMAKRSMMKTLFWHSATVQARPSTFTWPVWSSGSRRGAKRVKIIQNRVSTVLRLRHSLARSVNHFTGSTGCSD